MIEKLKQTVNYLARKPQSVAVTILLIVLCFSTYRMHRESGDWNAIMFVITNMCAGLFAYLPADKKDRKGKDKKKRKAEIEETDNGTTFNGTDLIRHQDHPDFDGFSIGWNLSPYSVSDPDEEGESEALFDPR